MTRNSLPLLIVALSLLFAACSSQPRQTGESPAEINARLGLNYMQQGSYDVALEKLKRALEQDPNLPAAHHYIAALYNTIRNFDLADQHYRRAVRLSPNDPALLNNYGVFLCEQTRYREAEERFVRAAGISGYQQPDEAWQNAAFCMLRIPDQDKAERYFRRALDINPLLPVVLYQLSQLNHDAGEQMHARAFLQRYEAIAPHSAQTLWLGVRIERALDNLPAADDYARQLREQFPRAEEAALLRELD
jgi:type IV pilus assembly protein PilF